MAEYPNCYGLNVTGNTSVENVNTGDMAAQCSPATDTAIVICKGDSNTSLSVTITDLDYFEDPGPCKSTNQSYVWTVDTDPNSKGSASSFPLTSLSVGTHTVKCKVTDGGVGFPEHDPQEYTYEWTNITVCGFSGITITPTTAEVCLGSPVTLEAKGTFPSDNSGTISWSCGGTGASITPTLSGPQVHNITATLTIGTVSTTSDSVPVVVKGITGISGPKTVHVYLSTYQDDGATATFTAQGVFGANPTEAVTWSGGTPAGGNGGASYSCKFDNPGIQTVTATCCGVTKTATILVLVPCTDCCARTCIKGSSTCSEENPCNWYDLGFGNPCECAFCSEE